MSIKSRMDKHIVVRSHHGLLHINEKEWACMAAGAWMHLRHNAERRQTQRNVLHAPLCMTFRNRTTRSQRSSDYFWGQRAGLTGRAEGGGCRVTQSVSRAWSCRWLHKGRTMWKLSDFVLRFTSCIIHAITWCCWWWRWWWCGWGCEWRWDDNDDKSCCEVIWIVRGRAIWNPDSQTSESALTVTLWIFIKWK